MVARRGASRTPLSPQPIRMRGRYTFHAVIDAGAELAAIYVRSYMRYSYSFVMLF
jgi:hypothetical protein